LRKTALYLFLFLFLGKKISNISKNNLTCAEGTRRRRRRRSSRSTT